MLRRKQSQTAPRLDVPAQRGVVCCSREKCAILGESKGRNAIAMASEPSCKVEFGRDPIQQSSRQTPAKWTRNSLIFMICQAKIQACGTASASQRLRRNAEQLFKARDSRVKQPRGRGDIPDTDHALLPQESTENGGVIAARLVAAKHPLNPKL